MDLGLADSVMVVGDSIKPVGDLIARTLAEIGVMTVFGVISIHNMPILDAVARQGVIRFVPACGETGAMNMTDALCPRVTLARRVHHQHRHRGGQRGQQPGGGADRRVAAGCPPRCSCHP